MKWLGDGVMFYFREPGGAVLAALDRRLIGGFLDAAAALGLLLLQSGVLLLG